LEAGEIFRNELLNIIQNENFAMINYVTDERRLNYKMLPSKTLSCSHEKSAPSLNKKEKVNMFAAMHLDSINYPM
jgi:hypothetical protein